jgi:hypothetical protein
MAPTIPSSNQQIGIVDYTTRKKKLADIMKLRSVGYGATITIIVVSTFVILASILLMYRYRSRFYSYIALNDPNGDAQTSSTMTNDIDSYYSYVLASSLQPPRPPSSTTATIDS